MTDEQLREIILRILGTIAPDADLKNLDPEVQFRDQFDFDSMDFLNFAVALYKEFKIDIPEKDYSRLATLNRCISYLQERLI